MAASRELLQGDAAQPGIEQGQNSVSSGGRGYEKAIVEGVKANQTAARKRLDRLEKQDDGLRIEMAAIEAAREEIDIQVAALKSQKIPLEEAMVKAREDTKVWDDLLAE